MLPLVFGCYGWTQDGSRRQIREAGSGIFVAPGLGVTARHVTESFRRLDEAFGGLDRRATPLDVRHAPRKVLEPSYREMIYQISGRGELAVPREASFWQVSLDWPSHDTDITVLRILPLPDGSNTTRERRFFDWQLRPPPVGAMVRVFGFPNAKIEADPIEHVLDLNLEMRPARVMEWFEPIRAHGFGEFPAFRLDRVLDFGFSGAPVLWNEHLVGVFSGPDVVATLWPLALYRFRDLIDEPFSELFESGAIDANDWRSVKDRAFRLPCAEALAGSNIASRCANAHAVLRDM